MGGKRIKPEPAHIRGMCIAEGCSNPQVRVNKDKYRARCQSCHNKKFGIKQKSYTNNKKSYCEECGFIAKHPCQLDVDHVNGNHKDDSPNNLMTLCANCHRLKTHINRDYVPT